MKDNATYRTEFRAEHIPSWYVGHVHLALTVGLSLGLIVWSVMQLQAVTWLEWLTVPLTFVYANLSEYLGHRYVMHVPRRGLRSIYVRHSKQHHRFFTDRHMPFEHHQDYKVTLFPLVLVVFFFGVFGAPVWFVLQWLFSDNVAWLFVLVAVAYFLNYELFHFAFHCRADSWVMKIPGIKKVMALHQQHHRPELMAKHNFNITYPLGDWLFGTYHKEPTPSTERHHD